MDVKQICRILVLLSIIICSGCAGKEHVCPKPEIQYITETVEVKVPVYTPPKIEKINRPVLPVTKLKKDSTPSEIAEAYYNSLKMEIKYASKLEDIISHISNSVK